MKLRYYMVILFLNLLCGFAWAGVDGFTGTSPVFSATVDEALGVPILPDKYDSQEIEHSEWHTAHVNTGQGMDFAHSQDFVRDSAATPVRGLIWGYKRGRVQIGNAFYLVAAGTVTLTESQTTYVQLNLDTPGVIQDSTGWLTANKHRPLFILRTNDTRVVGETNAMGVMFISDSPSAVQLDTFTQIDSGQAVFILQDFDKDTGNTSGLSFRIRAGRIRTYGGDTLFTVANTTITLADTSNNFIQITKDGVIFNDTNRFADTAQPLRRVTTRLNVVVKDTDERSFYEFSGNMRIVIMNGDERNTYAQNLREGKDVAWDKVNDSLYIATSATTWREIGGGSGGGSPDTSQLLRWQNGSPTASFTLAVAQSATGTQAISLSNYDTGLMVIIVGEVDAGSSAQTSKTGTIRLSVSPNTTIYDFNYGVTNSTAGATNALVVPIYISVPFHQTINFALSNTSTDAPSSTATMDVFVIR